jgi:hypothetical protein
LNIKPKWPKAAEENNIYGTVKIKYRFDDSCDIVDPVLIQKLGYGCDEEALRIFILMSLQLNQCNKRCVSCNCTTEEKIFSVHFMNPELEEFMQTVIYSINCLLIRFRLL